jgi:hypothetical protein
MLKLILLISVIILFLFSSSCGLGKSAVRREAEAKAQAWFDESFTKCGDDRFSNFGNDIATIYVTKFGSSEHRGLMQFKNLSYEIVETPLTDTDKLNGREWDGDIVLKNTQWRYHDGKKWSEWSDMLIIFSDELSKATNALIKKPNTPLLVSLEKSKGEWSGLGTYWRKAPCSQLPPH